MFNVLTMGFIYQAGYLSIRIIHKSFVNTLNSEKNIPVLTVCEFMPKKIN